MKVAPKPTNANQTSGATPTEVRSSKAEGVAKAKYGKGTEKSQAPAQAREAGAPEISQKAKEMATAKKVAQDTPDIREQKIAEIKKRIASGDYKVNAEATAQKMIEEHMATDPKF